MALHLRDFDVAENRFAQIAFTGHRGSGKSTELYRLEHDLNDRFFPLHLFIDDSLLRDCDYTDLMLWLVDALARQAQQLGDPEMTARSARLLEAFRRKAAVRTEGK